MFYRGKRIQRWHKQSQKQQWSGCWITCIPLTQVCKHSDAACVAASVCMEPSDLSTVSKQCRKDSNSHLNVYQTLNRKVILLFYLELDSANDLQLTYLWFKLLKPHSCHRMRKHLPLCLLKVWVMIRNNLFLFIHQYLIFKKNNGMMNKQYHVRYTKVF